MLDEYDDGRYQCSHIGHISADHDGVLYCTNCGMRESDCAISEPEPESDDDENDAVGATKP